MATLQINPMTTADIPVCAAIMAENELWQKYGVTLESANSTFTSALAQDATILTIRDTDQVLGFCWYVTHGAWDRSGYIRLIGLSPSVQGQGLGEKLLSEAERIMGEKVKDMFLLVSDFNLGAQHFYQRCGYQQIGAIPNYVKAGISELIFRKQLPARETK